MIILLSDLQVWSWPSTYLNKCFKWSTVTNYLQSTQKCRSYGPDKLNLDHFIIWPSCLTLTFNLLDQLFQMALLLLKKNNCTKLSWNPCINVEVMARTNPDRCKHDAHTPNWSCDNCTAAPLYRGPIYRGNRYNAVVLCRPLLIKKKF